ncbi:MAG TPA: hypothetical protein VGL06_17860 [Pseudonocardiaceae bacterium]
MSIDEFVFHDRRIFDAALDGDMTALRRAAGPDGVFCVDPERHAALLVFTGPDGFQQGNVHLPGQVMRWEIPHSFRVRDIHRADGRFVVTSADGRLIEGTARQFGRHPRLIDEPNNPDYQDQLAEIFRDTHLLPDHDAFPDAYPPIQDPVLGTVIHPGGDGHYAATVERDDVALAVSFDSAGIDRVTELLPHTHRLVTDIAGLHDRARDLIWASGADGTEPPGTRQHFDSVVRPTDLTVFRSGDFEVGFEDDGTYFQDGYWIAVCYRADTTPVHAYVDC